MSDAERTSYYQASTTWALDQQDALRGSVGRARLVAAVIAVVAVLEALALLLLMPLKTSTMVPILVDRQTGYVEVLKPDGTQQLRANDALVQSLLVQYVTVRESFDVTDLVANYHKVALWSGGPAKAEYLALMPATNPASPLRLYPRTTLVETLVKSVSPLGPHSALVRFETRRRDQNLAVAQPQEWTAVINYQFSSEALSASDRWLNPLGFEVLSYHRDAEAVLPAPPEAPAETNSAAAPSNAAAQAPEAAVVAGGPVAARQSGRRP